MNKIERYELIYIKCIWILLVGLLMVVSIYNLDQQKTINEILFYVQIVVISGIKLILIKKELLRNRFVYFTLKSLELIILAMSISFLTRISPWIYVIFLASITISVISIGLKKELMIMLSSILVFHLILSILLGWAYDENFGIGGFLISKETSINLTYYFTTIVFVTIAGFISEGSNEGEKQKEQEISLLKEKNKILNKEQENFKKKFDNLEENIVKMDEENNKLRITIAEFFTLQHISQAITSIFEPKELLRSINDIIIGVMGVSGSTVALFDEKRDKFKVDTTNIKNKEELIILNDNINCDFLREVLEKSRIFVENNLTADEYDFTRSRGIKSLICIPLTIKSKKFGLIILEQKFNNAFTENLLRILDIISQQIVIAIENAELYKKMENLATIDGLTNIYNRLYFQGKLEAEMRKAKDGKYSLVLAIFDVDYFKKFNDTYGHLFGDKVLISISQTVKNYLRSTDVFARFGGEEFIILFPHTTLKEAYNKVEKLRAKIASTCIKDAVVTSSVTVSFGISIYPEYASTEGELIKKADDALYEAKKCGRNCVKTSNDLKL